VSEKYELIDEEKDTMTPGGQKKYTTAAMCGWLEVSTAGYYEWRDRPPTDAARNTTAAPASCHSLARSYRSRNA
jgi:hypothetical protein